MPDEKAVGYKNVIIRPQIPEGVEWVKSSKETPYGTVRSEWSVSGDTAVLNVEIPANSTATLVLPYSAEECEVCGELTSAKGGVVALASGKYTIKVKR